MLVQGHFHSVRENERNNLAELVALATFDDLLTEEVTKDVLRHDHEDRYQPFDENTQKI